MTTTESETSTVVANSEIAELAGKLLQKERATASDLLAQIHHTATVAPRPTPRVPDQAALKLAENQVLALTAVTQNQPVVPAFARSLKPAEIRHFINWLDQLRTAKKAVETLDIKTKQILHNHFDVKLVEQYDRNGQQVPEDLPFHKDSGWFAVEDKTSGQVSDESQKIVREVSGGGINLTVGHLDKLLKQGQITTAEYSRYTTVVPTTVVNHTAIIGRIAEDPQFAHTLLEVAPPTAPTPSITLRPVS